MVLFSFMLYPLILCLSQNGYTNEAIEIQQRRGRDEGINNKTKTRYPTHITIIQSRAIDISGQQ